VKLFEIYLGFTFIFGFPALAVLTALQPLGWFYWVSTSMFIALFFWSSMLVMEGADGPVGFAAMLYFGLVGLIFLLLHSVKLLFTVVTKLIQLLRKLGVDVA